MSVELFVKKSAVISPCGLFRYRLDREFGDVGIVIAYCGVNPSTAGESVEDATTKKWRGFTLRNGGRKYIAINPFAFRATDVNALATAADPVGPENDSYIVQVLTEADVIVPCWGNRLKLPLSLRPRLTAVFTLIKNSGKPVKVFGFTQSGDPMHPLMLGYDTPLLQLSSGDPAHDHTAAQ